MTKIVNLWVVEVFDDGAWRPSLWVALSREEARIQMDDWRSMAPDDKLRVVKYAPAGGGRT